MQAENRKIDWPKLSREAWKAREFAHIYGKTKVGVAALSSTGKIYTGCNVEHIFRSHDVHAEVNAITNMIACGEKELVAILIVAEREKFTPCGSCMDWIFQFGGNECFVAYQNNLDSDVIIYSANELMPHYPF